MQRPSLIKKSFSGAGLLLASGLISCSPNIKPERPNIIFIMADDHAYQAISSYNNSLIHTPNIDRIANEGVRFSTSFCTNSICAPSRAVLLTGKYSHLNGHIDNHVTFDGSQQTFPKLLQQAGYQTALVGKWHLKSDPTGFDYWNILPGQGDYYNPDFIEMGNRSQEQGYVTNIITDKSFEWLDNRDKNKPFCLLLHHKAPHRNWLPDLKYLKKYKDKTFPIPDNFYDDYNGRIAAARQKMSIATDMSMDYDLKLPDSVLNMNYPDIEKVFGNHWGRTFSRMNEKEQLEWKKAIDLRIADYKSQNFTEQSLKEWKLQQYLKDYLACIESVDENVGRVLDYLEDNGLADNTIIVYTSDQGFYLGEHGWFDKRFMYEESLRMPLLIRYPDGIKPHVDLRHLVMNLDFAPTFLDYAGVDIPEDMQGESMKEILAQNNKNWTREAVYYHYYEYPAEHSVKRHYGIRTDRYKLIRFYYDIDKYELYDLESDPTEMSNLYGVDEYAEIQSKLLVQLFELRKQYSDTNTRQFYPPEIKEINHLAKGMTYTLSNPPSEKYSGGELFALTNGKIIPEGDWHRSSYKHFCGFHGCDMEVVIDLKEKTPIKSIEACFLQNQNDWIFLPEQIKFEVSSNGINFNEVYNSKIPAYKKDPYSIKKHFMFKAEQLSGRYIRISAKNIGTCPEWHSGIGEEAWIFADEIIIN